MQNESELKEVSLGNMGRMLPPLSLHPFISLHSFVEDLSAFSQSFLAMAPLDLFLAKKGMISFFTKITAWTGVGI